MFKGWMSYWLLYTMSSKMTQMKKMQWVYQIYFFSCNLLVFQYIFHRRVEYYTWPWCCLNSSFCNPCFANSTCSLLSIQLIIFSVVKNLIKLNFIFSLDTFNYNLCNIDHFSFLSLSIRSTLYAYLSSLLFHTCNFSCYYFIFQLADTL
jgi:hypothetical protein